MKHVLFIASSLVLAITLFWYAYEVQYPGVGFAGGPQDPQPLLSMFLSASGTLALINIFLSAKLQSKNLTRFIFGFGIVLLLITGWVRF